MKFLEPAIHDCDYDAIGACFEKYKNYISKISNSLPQGVINYILAPWHYDPRDAQSPHDSWLYAIELKSGALSNSAKIILLGAFHDRNIIFQYAEVSSFSTIGRENWLEQKNRDFVLDEVRLTDQGRVIHEIVFSGGQRIEVECKAFEVTQQLL